MKIVTLDLETSPNVAHVWGLFNQNVSLSQLRETTRILSFAAKFHDQKRVEFRSDFHDGHEAMILRAHEIMDEADAVVTWNGNSFDLKHLKREFILAGLTPPSPTKSIDLLLVTRKHFKFTSNKLQHVSTQLGLKGKVSHTGHQLWIDCLAGDEKAWALMRKYNIQDVRLTEEMYDRLRPWIHNHPHIGLYDGIEGDCCQRCGGVDLERRGYAYTPLAKFQQFKCRACGSWSRGKKALASVDVRGVGQ